MTFRRSGTLALVVLLLAAPLAGCLSSSGDDTNESAADSIEPASGGTNTTADGPSADGPARTVRDASGAELAPLTYANLDGPLREVLRKNGSASTEESCIGGGCYTQFVNGQQSYEQRFEITESIPANVPVRVEILLDPDNQPETSISPELNVTGAEVYRYDTDQGDDNETLTALVVRQPQGEVHAVADITFAHPQGSTYEMTVTLTADPTRVPTRVPVTVPVETTDANLTVAIGGENASGIDGMHWETQDILLDRAFQLETGDTWQLEAAGTTGEHVLALMDAEGYARIFAPNTTQAGMRALTLGYDLGEPTTVSPQGQAEVTATVERVPYAAGVYLQGTQPTYAYQGSDVHLASPNGTIVDEPVGAICLLCTGAGPNQVVLSDPGAQSLVPGAWTGTMEGTAAANAQFGMLFLRYQR